MMGRSFRRFVRQKQSWRSLARGRLPLSQIRCCSGSGKERHSSGRRAVGEARYLPSSILLQLRLHGQETTQSAAVVEVDGSRREVGEIELSLFEEIASIR